MTKFVELPTIARAGGPRPLDPAVAEFYDDLKANPGQWAIFPLERKTKPEVPEGYKVATRAGVHYVSYVG